MQTENQVLEIEKPITGFGASSTKTINKNAIKEDKEQELWVEAGKLNKENLRVFLKTQEIEWNHRLDVFEKALLAGKDVQIKTLALKAKTAVEQLEINHTKLMGNLVVNAKEDLFKLMIDFGKRTSKLLNDLAETEMLAPIKEMIGKDILEEWTKTQKKMKGGIDTYIEELEKKEEVRKKETAQ